MKGMQHKRLITSIIYLVFSMNTGCSYVQWDVSIKGDVTLYLVGEQNTILKVACLINLTRHLPDNI